MHCRVPFRTSLTCLAVVGCALLGTLCQNTEGAETSSSPSGLEARQILDDTGVQGGLIVHLGCGDGQLTAALRADERYLVHGLDHDRSNVARARAAIRAAGLYGPASADLLTSTQLPYGDNLVNLVVAEDLGPVARDEVMRVLAPGGTAYLRESGRWVKRIKPRPETIDEWSHFLHDASGNAVGKDEEVGPPRHMKWTTGPRYNISHEMNPSISACVTAGGRIFTILDEGVIGLPDQRFPSQWKLVARDAFNGMLLWKLPMPKWGWQQWNTVGLWSAPLTLSRRLVAEGDTVYVTLGYSAPLQALDAASGKTLRTYAGTEGADEVILSDDVLVVCVRKQLMVASEPKAQPTPTTAKGKGKTQKQQKPKKLNPHEWPLDKPGAGMVMAFDPATGKPLWRLTPENIVLLSIASEGGRLCYHNEEELKCFDLRTGKPLWQFPVKAPSTGRNTGGTLAMRDGVVLFTGAEGVVAVAAETGKQLWSGPRAVGTGATNPPDLLIAQGLVWFSQAVEAKSQTSITRSGRDLQTGEVKQTVTVANLISPMHHYRCYRSKGTENFLMLGKRGIEFLDLEGDDHMRHDWLRAPCSYGFIPANGLLYMPPSTCFCYPGVKLNGFNALAAKESVAPEVPGEARLLRGPAYGEAVAGADTHRADWPTYRSDIARSGRAKTALTAQLRVEWQEPLEGKASPPVIADGQLYVALIDQHAVCCIDAATGERRWMFTAGGRVDSPPTVWRDRVLFGSTDGYVYCVRASDGALAWRFLAAPHDRRLVSWDQVESVWPVHGSVVVLDDPERGTDAATVYCTAGRSSFLDGGLSLWALDAATGQSLHFTRYASRRPNVQSEEGQPFDMEGARSDVLTSDGTYLFLFQDVFDRELKPIEAPRLTTLGDRRTPSHLMTTGGFLDDSWWDRTYWTYGNRWPGFYFANEGSKAGQIIVFDEAHTFGLHVFRNRLRLSPGFTPGEGYELFADDNDNELYLAENSADREKGPGYSRLKPPVWSTEIPVRARAMVLADAAGNTGARAAGGRILFLAGPPDVVDPRDPLAAFEGRKGAVMWAVSAADGSKLAEYKLESEPIFNGMAAADGRLYLVDREGQLICFAGRN